MERSSSGDLRALALVALAAGLVLAGLVAFISVTTGSWDETDARLIGSSVGFGLASAAAASGARLIGDRRAWLRVVGALTVASATLAFLLLLLALWSEDPSDALWRAWGIAALVALWCTHMGGVLGSSRDEDPLGARVASILAVGALSLDTGLVIAVLAGAIERATVEDAPQLFSAALIVAVIASVLVPILRRLPGTPRPAAVTPPARAPEPPAWPEPRRVLSADRIAPGVWIAAPLSLALVFALGWALHRPGTTTVRRPVSSVVTVTAPPATDIRPGETFTRADADRVISRRRAGFDASAMERVRALASMVEHCFARTEDFTACDAAVEVPEAARAGLAWGQGDDQVAVEASAVATYTVAAPSRTGTRFMLARDPSGREQHTCTPAGTGGCRPDGTW